MANSPSSPSIDFTVVIPTFQRPEPLRQCLDALREQNYAPERFEVVVVDDGSRPPIAEQPIIRDTVKPVQCRFIFQENAGPAIARNTGAKAGNGKWLAFTDDDCAPRPDWLTNLADALRRQPNALVGGRCVNALPENLWSTASQQLLDHLYDTFNPEPENACFFASMNFAVERKRFMELSGFDPSYPLPAAEDRDLCDRWQHLVGPLNYCEAAVVDHAHRLTFKTFLRQHFNYGRGTPFYHQRRRQLFGEKPSGNKKRFSPTPEPLAFYLGLVASPLRKNLTRPRAWRLSSLMLLSQAAYVTGYAASYLRPLNTNARLREPTRTARV